MANKTHAADAPGARSSGAPPLRVLLVNDHLGYAGGQIHGVTRYLSNVVPALKDAGLRPSLCILRPRHPEAGRFEAHGIEPVFLARSKWDPRALRDLVRLIREREIDVLHLSGAKGTLLGRIAARLTGRPALIHVHDTIPFGALLRFLQARVARWTKAAIAISEPVRDLATRNMSLPAERIELLPYGLDLDRFAHPSPGARDRVRRELDLPADAQVVAILGRVSREKGHLVLMDAFAAVRREVPGVLLVVVGDGPLRAELEERAKATDLAGAVRFAGYRADVADVLAAADVVAMPSLWDEGFGLAALEAIAARRPVVGFRVGGIPMTVVDGKTGFLVERGDAEGLAERLTEVLRDDDLRARLADGCEDHARTFSLDRHVRRLVAVYEGMLGDGDASPGPDDRARVSG